MVRSLLAAGAVTVLLTVTACGGVDLSKQNFQRTTVPVEPADGQGKVPKGPITDSAVSVAALRGIDPCGLLDGGTLDELGKPGTPQPHGWSQCRSEVTDPGGKTITVRLTLGKAVMSTAEDATSGMSGLPLIVREQDSDTCFVTAMTSKQPPLGVTVQIGYEGGQSCRAGKVVLGDVVDSLHDQPPKREKVSGSLGRVDPCSAVDSDVISDALGGKAEAAPTKSHGCAWEADEPTVRLDFRMGYAPDGSEKEKKEVDLGHGVTGYTEQAVDSISKCTVTWVHRSAGEDKDELVSATYDNYAATEASKDKPCEKVVHVAKNAVATLSAK